MHQIGLEAPAVRGNLSHDHRRLQRRYKIESLPDSRIQRLGIIPFVIEVFFLVFAAWHKALRFIRKIDARLLAEPEHPRISFQPVDAQPVAHFIKIIVVGMRKGAGKVQPAENLAAGVAFFAQPVNARIENHLVRRHDLFRKRRGARDNLERRTGRILARDGLVVQRIIRILIDHLPIRFRNTVHEKIGVESGTADNRQHLARLRIHHDSGGSLRPNQ